MSIRLFVTDDRELIRAGLREFVRETDLEITAEAPIHGAARLLEDEAAFDLVILGMEPPGTEELALLDGVRAANAKLPVLLYAARMSSEVIALATEKGANGLVLHSASRSDFLESVRSAVRGETLWSRQDLRRAGAASRSMTAASDVQLTRREAEVITKMVEGLTNKQIAESLDISYETVKEHVQHVLQKVGVADRTQAAVWAVRQGLA